MKEYFHVGALKKKNGKKHIFQIIICDLLSNWLNRSKTVSCGKRWHHMLAQYLSPQVCYDWKISMFECLIQCMDRMLQNHWELVVFYHIFDSSQSTNDLPIDFWLHMCETFLSHFFFSLNFRLWHAVLNSQMLAYFNETMCRDDTLTWSCQWLLSQDHR